MWHASWWKRGISKSDLTFPHTWPNEVAGLLVKIYGLNQNNKAFAVGKKSFFYTSTKDGWFSPQRRKLLSGRTQDLGLYPNTKIDKIVREENYRPVSLKLQKSLTKY